MKHRNQDLNAANMSPPPSLHSITGLVLSRMAPAVFATVMVAAVL